MRSIAGTKRGHLGGLLAAILVAIVGVLAIPSMPATAATKSTYIFGSSGFPVGSWVKL
jgi:hypothetical protein